MKKGEDKAKRRSKRQQALFDTLGVDFNPTSLETKQIMGAVGKENVADPDIYYWGSQTRNYRRRYGA